MDYLALSTACLVMASILSRSIYSGTIKCVLISATEKPVPFDFLIEGEILRTSIAQYLLDHRLSTVFIYVIS